MNKAIIAALALSLGLNVYSLVKQHQAEQQVTMFMQQTYPEFKRQTEGDIKAIRYVITPLADAQFEAATRVSNSPYPVEGGHVVRGFGAPDEH